MATWLPSSVGQVPFQAHQERRVVMPAVTFCPVGRDTSLLNQVPTALTPVREDPPAPATVRWVVSTGAKSTML
jgi:hypothetical protein